MARAGTPVRVPQFRSKYKPEFSVSRGSCPRDAVPAVSECRARRDRPTNTSKSASRSRPGGALSTGIAGIP